MNSFIKFKPEVVMKNLKGILLLSLVLGMAASLHAQDAGKSGYKILQSVPLPGDGGYDFLTVDSDARRVYITHNNSVQIVDADALTLLERSRTCPSPRSGFPSRPGQGIRLQRTARKRGGLRPEDLQTPGRDSTEKDCDVILYDKPSNKVLTFNGDSHTASMIDPATDKLDKTVTLDGGPEVAVSNGKGQIFDNLEPRAWS